MKKYRRVLVWMRRSFRVDDNTPLLTALHDAAEVVPVVCLRDAARYTEDTPRRRFVKQVLASLDEELRKRGSALHVFMGDPGERIPFAANEYNAEAVYATRVHDPGQKDRDQKMADTLRKSGASMVLFDDHVLRNASEVMTGSGLPYRVFTPFKRAWLAGADEILRPAPAPTRIPSPPVAASALSLSTVRGFREVADAIGERGARKRLHQFLKYDLSTYKDRRDVPGVDGTSRLSHFLSVGALSVRRLYWETLEEMRDLRGNSRDAAETFIGEIIWREFYQQILAHFPHVARQAFREQMASIQWSTRRDHFERWCKGETGYPIVDAGMRQLQHEGWMHNRVRMIVASFLTKDLHLNWQWGERFFFDRLIDADLASNNGGWQWTAGTGTDASPWFRIFNPITQAKRFDPDGAYVRRYVPELSKVPVARIHEPDTLSPQDQIAYGCRIGKDYPAPMVNHQQERAVTLALYSARR